ncbi:AI-2 transport protein TqsA [Aquisphaera giovannonii]|uniref:AI-2 transport protein TqsA n=1 Tax=Aquisphaera giovannonii TaxID=406548 RepID=A0A5B9W4W6_9BACT|nr:AI-2E family transporter [Aquisphaera giovannonii]QEH35736.1 AI-2 transport protein TqsA [Aquisphaera giovannonii]
MPNAPGRPPEPAPATAGEKPVAETLDTQTTVLFWIAGMLLAGAAWLMSAILVPFVLGLVLAIALSPAARWLEKHGLGRTGSSLACLVLVIAVLAGTSGLLVYQAGTILQQSDKYYERLSRLMADATRAVGGERLLQSLKVIQEKEGQGQGAGEKGGERAGGSPTTAEGEAAGKAAEGGGGDDEGPPDRVEYWVRMIRNNMSSVGGWAMTGLGGFVGVLGSAIICLSFLFYLLESRDEWIGRILRILYFLGLRPRRESLERAQKGITTFGGFVTMVSLCGWLVIGTTAWLLGLPQPYLWGLIFGLLEFIPYFGPMVGGSLVTLVAIAAGTGWWQPLTMLGVILVWLTLEGYVISPLVYGRAVHFDPVMVLVAILFFGWLWGPLGMITALPMMVILRELVNMTPESPALDALLEPHEESSGGGNKAGGGPKAAGLASSAT